MMKNNFLKNLVICTLVSIGISAFGGTNEVKVNAETNGSWVYENNSWRYYSGPTMKVGWTQYNGCWYYLDDNGRLKTGWIKSEGKWYYLDSSSGKMLTRWIEDNGKWYYLNSSGEMRIGWLEENGNLFYLNDAGEMVKNAYIDSYYFESNGAGKKTWHNKEDNRSR